MHRSIVDQNGRLAAEAGGERRPAAATGTLYSPHMVFRGQTLGKYRILEPLGSGGFGTVYLAEDTWIDKRVAIKVPHRQNLDFGELLREIQRVKSEGDYKAGRDLIENYGVKVDPELHKEVLDRYNKVGIAPYAGFIQPRLVPVMNGDKITDVKVEYPMDFVEQMLEFGKKHALLPAVN